MSLSGRTGRGDEARRKSIGAAGAKAKKAEGEKVEKGRGERRADSADGGAGGIPLLERNIGELKERASTGDCGALGDLHLIAVSEEADDDLKTKALNTIVALAQEGSDDAVSELKIVALDPEASDAFRRLAVDALETLTIEGSMRAENELKTLAIDQEAGVLVKRQALEIFINLANDDNVDAIDRLSEIAFDPETSIADKRRILELFVALVRADVEAAGSALMGTVSNPEVSDIDRATVLEALLRLAHQGSEIARSNIDNTTLGYTFPRDYLIERCTRSPLGDLGAAVGDAVEGEGEGILENQLAVQALTLAFGHLVKRGDIKMQDLEGLLGASHEVQATAKDLGQHIRGGLHEDSMKMTVGAMDPLSLSNILQSYLVLCQIESEEERVKMDEFIISVLYPRVTFVREVGEDAPYVMYGLVEGDNARVFAFEGPVVQGSDLFVLLNVMEFCDRYKKEGDDEGALIEALNDAGIPDDIIQSCLEVEFADAEEGEEEG